MLAYLAICKDYGYESDFKIKTESEQEFVQQVKKHWEEEDSIDLPKGQNIQMGKL